MWDVMRAGLGVMFLGGREGGGLQLREEGLVLGKNRGDLSIVKERTEHAGTLQLGCG